MSDPITYIQLIPESAPPALAVGPARFVIVVNTEVIYDWQKPVSDWVVGSGSLYMMAWGPGCSSWDDSFDWANLDQFWDDPIPDDQFIVTTWHDDEPLEEVFWFSKTLAQHHTVKLVETVILDISTANRKDELLGLYESA